MEDADALKKQHSGITVGQVLSSGSNPGNVTANGDVLLIEDGNVKSQERTSDGMVHHDQIELQMPV